ncbi:MarR family winged helix-turn-helix transcriptional regulator [Actinomadura sp. 9N407]|uniref:MarR family winged helix-turn-helix transcriptional regulator n=1 Tax=Actinomadura sp. 9N407 TaxID=3375154 RepID=UPI0037B58627
MTTADDAQPARLRHAPSWLFGQISVYGHRLLNERLAAAGGRGYHYRLLAALEEFGPASQAAIGRRTGIDRSDVVAALNELGDRKLIERTPDPGDRRRNIITITPDGREHLERLDAVLSQVQDELLAPLAAAEREQLTGLMTRVADHHRRTGNGERAGAASSADHISGHIDRLTGPLGGAFRFSGRTGRTG